MVSVLLATTGRPAMAESSVIDIRETTEDHEVEIIASVDADPETASRIHKLVDVLDYSVTYRGCSQAWNDALSDSSGDPVVLAADDLVWHPGWLSAALETLSQFEDGWSCSYCGFAPGSHRNWCDAGCGRDYNDMEPVEVGGLVGFNDGHSNGDHFSTHYLMSRRFIIEILGGVIAWPHYKHSFNDVEASARAKAAGRYKWCKDAHVFHSHWIFGDRSQDETDARNLGGHPESQRTFFARQAAGFPNDGITPAITE